MEWISVKDRLPIGIVSVAAWVVDGDYSYISIATLHSEFGCGEYFFVDSSRQDWRLPVTHWIPLPEPPED